MNISNSVPIVYVENYVTNPDAALLALQNELEWVRHGTTPRYEYYVNKYNLPYTYGREQFARTYQPQPNHPVIYDIGQHLEITADADFEVCFLNRYKDQSDHLGWHADDSPEMDDARPIAIVSLGVEREIWFCKQDNKTDVTKLRLAHGSLCLMLPGMQNTHFHRIPKSDRICGERISLTYRGLDNSVIGLTL